MTLIYLKCLLAVTASSSVATSPQCPLWTSPQNGSCKCGNDLKGIVKCEDGRGAYALTHCFCMTTIENQSSPVVGPCFVKCTVSRNTSYILFTGEKEKLNNVTCGSFNRAGTACGHCIEGYGLPVYSYNLSCVECTDYKYNWFKYIAVAYGPLTVFYFIIILFRISVLTGDMMGYITISQMMTTIGLATQLFFMSDDAPFSRATVKIYLSLLSIWNLDFFRSLYPPFCLHPHLSALQTISLDYIVAVYPMILVLLTYLLIKLHDRFRLVVWLCRPAYTCFRHFRNEWDIKTSLIGAFATFYLLSYVKILDISAHLLTPTDFFNMNGNRYGNHFFFYNGTIPYLGKEHLSYAALAMTLTLVFNILPLVLLCLYPCPCFQRCLNKSRYQWHTLHTFMDAILGYYTHRPRERRYFAAIYLMLRLIHIVAFVVLNPLIYPIAACRVWMLAIVLVAIFRPYRKNHHNIIDIILFALIHFSYMWLIHFLEGMLVDPIETYKDSFLYCIASYSALLMTALYGVVLLLWSVSPHKFIKTCISAVVRRVCCWKRSKVRKIEQSLPYRLEHDGERESLLINGVVQYYNGY